MQVPPSAPNAPPPQEPGFEFAEPENDDEMSDADTSPGARTDAPTKVKTTVQVTKLCAVLARGLPASVLGDAAAAATHTIHGLEDLAKDTVCPHYAQDAQGCAPTSLWQGQD